MNTTCCWECHNINIDLSRAARINGNLICGDCLDIRDAHRQQLKDTTKTGRFSGMHDSGKREESNTGALTDPGNVQAAMELLSPYSTWRLAAWLGKGAKKYAPRNWEKGIPFSICYGKLKRHIAECEMGLTNEDHLAAVGFWWHALTHYEKMIEMGILPAELDDMPKYEQQKKESKK